VEAGGPWTTLPPDAGVAKQMQAADEGCMAVIGSGDREQERRSPPPSERGPSVEVLGHEVS